MSSNYFTPPWTAGPVKDYSGNFELVLGVNIDFSWAESITGTNELRLVQDSLPGSASVTFRTVARNITGTSYRWKVSYYGEDPTDPLDPLNLDFSNVFYLSIKSDTETNTHYFGIKDRGSTTSPPIKTSITSSPTSTSIVTPTNLNNAPIPTQTVLMNSSLEAGPIAGIAIGSSLGVLLLVVATWFGFRAFQKRHVQTPSARQSPGDINTYQGERHYYGNNYLHEAQGNVIYEAGDSQAKR